MEGFERDDAKAAENLDKHGVSFEEAATVWQDFYARSEPDDEHSWGEDRYRLTGLSARGRLLVVVYTEREPRTRIIGAWAATSQERSRYERGDDD